MPLANMLFGAKNANIAQHLRRLDCRVHEETPRPLKLTHGRSIALWSKDQISATDFAILTLMTKYRCRTRWEHSKSELLLDDNARHDPRSPSLFGAQQHLCKRSSALAVLTRRHRGKTCATLKKYVTTDRYQVRPNEGQRYRENGLTANILKYFIYLFQERFNP